MRGARVYPTPAPKPTFYRNTVAHLADFVQHRSRRRCVSRGRAATPAPWTTRYADEARRASGREEARRRRSAAARIASAKPIGTYKKRS